MKRALAKKSLYRSVSAVTVIACGAVLLAPAGAARAEEATVDSSDRVQEIIVSANRRDERAQDVPMTIQAFSGQALQDQHISTLDDLIKMTPNVSFANNGPGQGNIYMRGLSTGFAGNQSSAAVGGFPNVAVYLDDQSMQFPARNVDIYMVDMDRVEVLEGPQGTLFGGGAEAGVLRYITNKPKLGTFEASAEGSYSFTAGGDPNNSENAMINIPIIKDRLAVRAVVYNERQGGYINNVPSNFSRSDQDLGNYYIGIKPNSSGICPSGNKVGKSGYCTTANSPTVNNQSVAGNAQNPTTYDGARISVAAQLTDDWDLLVQESLSNLDAEGMSSDNPIGANFQTLKPLETTYFSPTYDKDRWQSTAVTVNGKVGDFKVVYSGSYMTRHIDQQMDYTNYARSPFGAYYQCTGGNTPWGTGNTPTCYSPIGYWHDTVDNSHLSNELRVSTPDWSVAGFGVRAIAGAFREDFKIQDVMDFNYRTIPTCDQPNAVAGTCVNNVATYPGSTSNNPGVRGDNTAFGEDLQRGYSQDAGFASLDIDVIPDVLTITGGSRFYRYDEYEKGSLYQTGPNCLVQNPCYKLSIDAEHEKKHYQGFRSKANTTWKITPDQMVYFTYSEGFRPGAFSRSAKTGLQDGAGQPQFIAPLGYSPDFLTNYEIGTKSEFFDKRLQLNASAYYMQWTNVQQFLYNPTYGLNNTVGVNGADYDVKGLETQIVAKPLEGWTFNSAASWNLNTQASSPCLTNDNPLTATDGNKIGAKPGQCITSAQFNGGINPVPNVLGQIGSIAPFSPRWQGSAHLRYDTKIAEYKAYGSFGINYIGAMNSQPANYTSGEGVLVPNTTFLLYRQPSYYTLDANFGVMKDNWSIGLFGSNLNNTHASMFTSSAQFIRAEVPVRPAVIGLKLGATF
ncbi:MAG TPA: TonB-dependent receptor [Magnetospirillaceae bacterium]|nr:TonB-dependent receptor [Magnetospirillaceae bacterium]